MKLTIAKTVNERIGAASVTAPATNSKAPGDTVSVKSVIYGDVIEGNGIWYKSDDGFYYWSGGFYETNFVLNNTKLSDFTYDQQIEILRMVKNHSAEILGVNVKGYMGCGIGSKNLKHGAPLALIVYVDKKVKKLPVKVLKEINYKGISIKTDVVELHSAKHHYIPNNKQNLELDQPPFIGGGIEDGGQNDVGTRSLAVRRLKQGSAVDYDYFLLTCYHVVLDYMITNNSGEDTNESNYTGDKGYQAIFPLDGSNSKSTIAEGVYNNDYDYAAVKLDSSGDVLNEINGNRITAFVNSDEFNAVANVYTMGYESGYQTGRVLSMYNSLSLTPHNQTFDNLIYTEKISVEGDSGAPVIDAASHKLIGFVIGGNDVDKSYILPFYNLNYQKNFSLITI